MSAYDERQYTSGSQMSQGRLRRHAGRRLATAVAVVAGSAAGGTLVTTASASPAAALPAASTGVSAVAIEDWGVYATINIGSGAGPTAVSVDESTDTVYVADYYSDTVSVIDGSTDTVVGSIPVGEQPIGLAFDPHLGTLYVANQDDSPGDLSVVDTSSCSAADSSGCQTAVVGTIAVGTDPYGVAYDAVNGTIYVTDSGDHPGEVSSFTATSCNATSSKDCATAVVSHVDVGDDPVGVAVDPSSGAVFVTNEGDSPSDVSVINPETNRVTGTIPVGTAQQGHESAPFGVAVDSANGNVYVANEADSPADVSSFSGSGCDTGCSPTVSSTDVGNHPVGIGVDPSPGSGGVVFATNLGDDSVSVVDGASNAILQPAIGVGHDPFGIGVDPVTSSVYVSNTTSDTVSVLGTVGLSVVKRAVTSSFSVAGAETRYDFLVTNTGKVSLSNIAVTDTVSAPASEANVTTPQCPDSDLAPGAAETCTASYTVTQADLDHGSVTDTAVASGQFGAPGAVATTVTSSSSSVSVPAFFAKVTLTKSAATLSPDEGGDDTFTLTATNAGPSESGAVTVVDPLPVGLTYVSSSSSTGSVTVTGETVTWDIVDLAASGAGSFATLSLVVRVGTTDKVGNTATFTQANPNGSGGESGESNTVTLTPDYAVLEIGESVLDPRPSTGSSDRFTVVVTNKGPDLAKEVAVTDPVPAGVSVVSATSGQGTVTTLSDNGAEILDWHVGTLDVDSSVSLTVNVTITSDSGTIVNPATATDSTSDPTGQTKHTSASLVVVSGAVVPPTHTGEPWSSLTYWALVLALFGITLLGLETRRRRIRSSVTRR
jgi:uncharacterized repeat protein (TIGR01451 family)